MHIEKTIVLHLSEAEAGMLLHLARMVNGAPLSRGRSFTSAIEQEMEAAGIRPVEAYDGDITAR